MKVHKLYDYITYKQQKTIADGNYPVALRNSM